MPKERENGGYPPIIERDDKSSPLNEAVNEALDRGKPVSVSVGKDGQTTVIEGKD